MRTSAIRCRALLAARSPPAQAVAGDFVKSEMPQAAYRWQGHGG